MKVVRAAMIGDVIGEPGLKALEENLPRIITDNALDFTVVNGENAAEGFGMTEASLTRIIASGADVVTSGNHVWEKRDFWPVMEAVGCVLRPANYPPGCAGRGWLRVEKGGLDWVVINLQGRELMTPIDCPFRGFDNIVKDIDNGIPIIIVDFHAESSREKEAMGYYVDGRAALVAGTHTHVQTADERILPKETAYITDLGMTGVSGSVIGMDVETCLDRTRKQVLYRMEPAAAVAGKRGAGVQGVIAEINAETGRALSIRRI